MIETGIQAFSTFKEKTLLPDAFCLCQRDTYSCSASVWPPKKQGYSIPDFLVTGFDNEDKASYYEPRITTVGFSKADINENALLMLEKSEWKCRGDLYIRTFHLRFSESCGCVPEST